MNLSKQALPVAMVAAMAVSSAASSGTYSAVRWAGAMAVVWGSMTAGHWAGWMGERMAVA